MRGGLKALFAASDPAIGHTLWGKLVVKNGAGQADQIGTPGLSGPSRALSSGTNLDLGQQAPVYAALLDDGVTRRG